MTLRERFRAQYLAYAEWCDEMVKLSFDPAFWKEQAKQARKQVKDFA